MRLKIKEIEAIACTFQQTFHEGRIFLFGSRLDDRKKGGDIDLFIITNNKQNLYKKKLDFLVKLKNLIGDRAIDLVVKAGTERSIDKLAQMQGIEMDVVKIKIDKYYKECDKHILRIVDAYEEIKTFYPLTASDYENLTKEQIKVIDQFLFRFAKLQDTFGDKLFRLIVSLYESDSIGQQKSFFDILNSLEKFGYLHSAKEWLQLRELRNNIAYQYEEDSEEMSLLLNTIFTQKEILIRLYQNFKNKYNNDFPVSE